MVSYVLLILRVGDGSGRAGGARLWPRRGKEHRVVAAHDATQPDSDLGAGSSADGSLAATSPSKEPSVSLALAGSSAFFARRSRVDATQTYVRLMTNWMKMSAASALARAFASLTFFFVSS